MSREAVEIKLNNVVYQVEREFVGTASCEDLLRKKLEEDIRSSLFRIEIDSTMGMFPWCRYIPRSGRWKNPGSRGIINKNRNMVLGFNAASRWR